MHVGSGRLEGTSSKDVDISDTEDLTVPWSSLGLYVAPHWLLCTDAANDDTRIVFSSCGITLNNLFVMPVCVSNVHHISQLPDFLVAASLVITLVMLRMLLVKIYRR